ncbi:unnamed protein product [Sphagnum tenellum]
MDRVKELLALVYTGQTTVETSEDLEGLDALGVKSLGVGVTAHEAGVVGVAGGDGVGVVGGRCSRGRRRRGRWRRRRRVHLLLLTALCVVVTVVDKGVSGQDAGGADVDVHRRQRRQGRDAATPPPLLCRRATGEELIVDAARTLARLPQEGSRE